MPTTLPPPPVAADMRTARRPVTAARLRPAVGLWVVAARRLMPARALPLLRDLAIGRLCARAVWGFERFDERDALAWQRACRAARH